MKEHRSEAETGVFSYILRKFCRSFSEIRPGPVRYNDGGIQKKQEVFTMKNNKKYKRFTLPALVLTAALALSACGVQTQQT